MDRDKSRLRDEEELEGTLLLPEALPVAIDDETGDDVPTTTVTTATAMPVSHFEYSSADKEEEEDDIEVAPTIPTDGSDFRLSKDAVARGVRKGRMHAEQEKEDIRRANRNVYAIDYNTREAIKHGNRYASEKKRAEDKGLTQTSWTQGNEQYTPQTWSPAPEFYEGTYGSEYEVKEYDTGAYDTKDYDVSEYKSVYES